MFVEVSRYKTYTRVRIVRKVPTPGGTSKRVLVEHIGSARSEPELAILRVRAEQRMAELRPQLSLLAGTDATEQTARSHASRLSLGSPFASGLWRTMGSIYDRLDLPADGLLKYLVLARIALPKSKRATVRYLADNLQFFVGLQTVYDYMDTLNKDNLMAKLLAYAQEQALARSGGTASISVVFYDVTTLYFETDEEDEDREITDEANNTTVTHTTVVPGLRKKGYSKDHRYDLPQVVVGLTVDNHGFPLDFQVYEGNTYEGQTLLAGVQKIQQKLQLGSNNLTVVADAGMLSQANLEKLESSGYSYIVGARIRSLPKATAEQILVWDYTKHGDLDTAITGRRMVVTYSDKRAKRSKQNRERLVQKLQAKLVRGDIVKKNKYVVLEAGGNDEAIVTDQSETKQRPKFPKLTGRLDTEKLEHDARFDGLKGYVTNTKLSAHEVVAHYGNLWNVEKSFRMGKSDLRARPTFHYKRERVIAHLTICVCSLGVLRAFEEQLRIRLPTVGVSIALEQLLQIRDYQLKLPNGQVVTVQTELSVVQQKLQGW